MVHEAHLHVLHKVVLHGAVALPALVEIHHGVDVRFILELIVFHFFRVVEVADGVHELTLCRHGEQDDQHDKRDDQGGFEEVDDGPCEARDTFRRGRCGCPGGS